MNFLKCNMMAYQHQKNRATDASRHGFHFSYCVASDIYSIIHIEHFPCSMVQI